jgi:uncharacterized protein YjlB
MRGVAATRVERAASRVIDPIALAEAVMAQLSGNRVRRIAPATWLFADDGLIPNNPMLPLVIYRRAIDVVEERDPAALFETTFARNNWTPSWRNGIYTFAHYHSMCHEVLGIARGGARVRFGGALGEDLDVHVGDVAILPAGTGHQRLAGSHDLLVVGAYPPQGTYDLCRATPQELARARETIPNVARPQADPLYGAEGPLMQLWAP